MAKEVKVFDRTVSPYAEIINFLGTVDSATLADIQSNVEGVYAAHMTKLKAEGIVTAVKGEATRCPMCGAKKPGVNQYSLVK